MQILSLPQFTSAIEAIQFQNVADRKFAETVNDLFGTDDTPIYNNSLLIKGILDLLHIHFPKDENGFSDIEHWIYDLNYGKGSSDSEVISIEDLYYELTKGENFVFDQVEINQSR